MPCDREYPEGLLAAENLDSLRLRAAFAEAWNVMLLSASMVNAFICSSCLAAGPHGHRSGAEKHQVDSAGVRENQGLENVIRGKRRAGPFSWRPNCRSDVGSTPESRIDPCSFRSTIVAGAGSSPCFIRPNRFGIHDRTRAGLVTAPRAGFDFAFK